MHGVHGPVHSATMTLLLGCCHPALRRPMLGAAISKLLVVLCLFQPLIGIAQAFYSHATRTTRTSTRHEWEHGRWGDGGGGCLGVGNSKHVPYCFGDGDSFRSVSAGNSSPRRNVHVAVFMTSSSGGGDDDPHNSSSSDDMLFGEAGLLVALSVVATTLGVATLYSLSTNPFVDFDVDLFLSINRALNSGSTTSIGGGGVADGVMGGGEIVELPALSPAEQIVGAFFGPPRR